MVTRRDPNKWLPWEEGNAPDFVVEVASEETVDNDRVEKRDDYAAIGVREYWRFDPTGGTMYPEILIGERLENGKYVRLEITEGPPGKLRGYSEALELFVCVRADGKLRFFDPVTRQWLPVADKETAAPPSTGSGNWRRSC